MERELAKMLADLVWRAQAELFVVAPLSRAELGEYSDLVGPAQMQTFAILASIGNQYPDLDRTVAPEPPGAQSPVPFHSVSDMRKALEDCITLLTQSRRLMGGSLAGGELLQLDRRCAEAEEAVNAARNYLARIPQPGS